MRAYGLTGVYPIAADLDDIASCGLKSSISRVPSKGGDIKNSFRRVTVKAAVRRYWKRVERAAGKSACRNIEGV